VTHIDGPLSNAVIEKPEQKAASPGQNQDAAENTSRVDRVVRRSDLKVSFIVPRFKMQNFRL
jgi:hypothetical protein